MLSLPDQLQRQITPEPTSGCWLWTGSLTTKGYGHVCIARKLYSVHRLVWSLLVGPITTGLHLDHKCRVRSCCNPSHLREVTARENALAPGSLCITAINAAKAWCVRGHELEPVPWGRSRRWRFCRTCSKASKRRSYRAKKLATGGTK